MTVRPAPRVVATAAAGLIGLAAVAGCSQSKANETTGGFVSGNGAITVVDPDEREPAPEISGESLRGKEIGLSDFSGKTVVVNVWASWCAPCRKEAPELVAAAEALPDKNVQFLGIAIRDEASNARAFNDRYGVEYPSINDPASRSLLGFRDSLAAVAVPTTYIIDEQGRVAVRILDKTTTGTLTDLVEQVRSGDSGTGSAGSGSGSEESS